MTAESPLERLRELADEWGRVGDDRRYLYDLAPTLRAVIAALEAESETTVEYVAVSPEARRLSWSGEKFTEAEAWGFLHEWHEVTDEWELEIVTRTTTTHRTEWSTPNE